MQVYDWQSIVNEHGPLVWQTAYRLVGNEADAADCLQETFLAALEVSRREEVRNLGGLLVRLATTRAIDSLRRRNRQQRRSGDRFDPNGRGENHDADPGRTRRRATPRHPRARPARKTDPRNETEVSIGPGPYVCADQRRTYAAVP
ncbi:MAG: sigma-70 family RNA polymerase sigma factor [Sedimentisphaerales bacterium]|nr:sigma-70 family RNA polymerase sigma factor [Sedimentisphaerales bacterium]